MPSPDSSFSRGERDCRSGAQDPGSANCVSSATLEPVEPPMPTIALPSAMPVVASSRKSRRAARLEIFTPRMSISASSNCCAAKRTGGSAEHTSSTGSSSRMALRKPMGSTTLPPGPASSVAKNTSTSRSAHICRLSAATTAAASKEPRRASKALLTRAANSGSRMLPAPSSQADDDCEAVARASSRFLSSPHRLVWPPRMRSVLEYRRGVTARGSAVWSEASKRLV